MVVDFGYGVDMSRAEYKTGAAKYVLENYATEDILSQFRSFCADNEDLVESGDAEDVFAEEFEDDFGCGVEEILVLCINDRELGCSHGFRYDNHCIYYGARIPGNDDEKASLLTAENIRCILAKYLGPILNGDLVVEYLEISQ